MVSREVEDLLKNWAFWCVYGYIGPPRQTQAASAEGNYLSDDIWEGKPAHYEPNMLEGERVEELVREMPMLQRRVLKATYISFPYQSPHSVSQRLGISVMNYEAQLRNAKKTIADRYKTL
jgi:hypothetical protein